MEVLKEKYIKEVIPALMKEFNYKNINQVPKLVKVVINMGLGEGAKEYKIIEEAVKELALIAGQRPVVTKSKKAIAGFSLRENQPVGCKVTLRKSRMYEFLYKLMNVAMPRIKDFQGASPTSFDGKGNYALGIKEHIIFPEIKLDKVSKVKGMDIIIVTSAKTDKEAFKLLELLGMPFRKIKESKV